MARRVKNRDGAVGAGTVLTGTVLTGTVVVGAAVAGWEGTLSRDSAAAHWSVLGLVVLGLTAAVLAGRGRQRTPSQAWLVDGVRSVAGWRRRPPAYAAGVVVWVVLLLAVVGWDLNSFVHQAHDLPTFSYYVGRVTRFQWGRALMFAVWIGIGTYLALGWRRPGGRGR